MTRSKNLGMRILCLTLTLVCLLACVPGVAAAPEAKPQTLTTLVRNGANHSAFVIGQMENGTQVTVLSSQGEFYKVDCYDMTGYVAMSQIRQTEDGKYYINCQRHSSETSVLEYTDYADALTMRHSLLELAQKQLGKPYIYGSTGTAGFDCSGLMLYLFANHGVSLHRRASEQLQDGIVVAREGLQVGDLIFFREPWDSCAASHVGIYAGDNRIIHAGSRGIAYADLDGSYYADNYLCARRVVNTGSAQLQTPATAVTANSAVARTVAAGRRTAK